MDDFQLWPGEMLELAGSQVFVRHIGRDGAPPMVYVHGLGGSSLNWLPLMQEISGEFDHWALDLPGFGESPPARQSIAAYAEVVTGLLTRFGRPVDVTANSMGGLTMVRVAARRPDLMRSLTLISPAMPQRQIPREAIALSALAAPGVGPRLMAKISDVPAEQQVRRLLGMLYGEPDRLAGEDLQLAIAERERRMELGHSNIAFVQALRSILGNHLRTQRWSAWGEATRIQCPLLVVLGGRDVLVGLATGKRWRRLVPAAQVVTFPTTGHIAMLERPKEIAELVREHVSC